MKSTKGITLLALVITIIILLILASIALNLGIGEHGLIRITKEAVNSWDDISEDESKQTSKLANKMSEIRENRVKNDETENPDKPSDDNTRTDIEIGGTVTYIPPTKSPYTLQTSVSGESSIQYISQNIDYISPWRVLNINEDGSLELISEKVTGTFSFKGASGYNNAVFALNDMASYLYSNEELGITARSVNIDDIEKQMNSFGIEDRNSCTINGTKYGNTMSFSMLASTYTNYPDIAKYEEGITINGKAAENGIKKSETYSGYETGYTTKGATLGSSLKVTQTQYYLSEPEKCFDNSDIYNIFFGNSLKYYLASREIASNRTGSSRYAVYSISVVINENFKKFVNQMYESIAGSNSMSASLRPIVTIPANLELSKNEETGNYEIINNN